MNTPEKHWQVMPPISDDARRALERWADEPVVQQLFYNRNLVNENDALRYVKGEPGQPDDPFLLPQMDVAVDRIRRALRNNERVAVYGDYDVDGITSTALLVTLLRRGYGADVTPYIPNRFDEGYGLNKDALGELERLGVTLVITVDCGVRSLAEAAFARSIGLDMIITDHHHFAPGVDGSVARPEAVALINPKDPTSGYPETMLAGVGIAFKLAQALMQQRPPDRPGIDEDSLIDLVALGTVADLAPLTGENRVLVKRGLEQINRRPRPGVRALMDTAGLRLPISAGNIGFQLGPRLNAAGRLESAMGAFDLLTTDDTEMAQRQAARLHSLNQERQDLTERITEHAAELAGLIDASELPPVIIAAHPSFNPGVVGLAASRLVERYYRPTLVAHEDNETITGSARSIGEFHITEALDQCADLLLRYGGHSAAAGYTTARADWPEFVSRLTDIATEQLADADLHPTLTADTEVTLGQVTERLALQVNFFEPTGYGNPAPRFVAYNVPVRDYRVIGKERNHLKLMLARDEHTLIDGLAWRMADRLPELGSHVDILFALEFNEYRGKRNLQLNIKDLKPASA